MPKVAMRVVDVYRFVATVVRGWLSKAANDLRGAVSSSASSGEVVESRHGAQRADNGMSQRLSPNGTTWSPK